jgi:hypothetical protein
MTSGYHPRPAPVPPICRNRSPFTECVSSISAPARNRVVCGKVACSSNDASSTHSEWTADTNGSRNDSNIPAGRLRDGGYPRPRYVVLHRQQRRKVAALSCSRLVRKGAAPGPHGRIRIGLWRPRTMVEPLVRWVVDFADFHVVASVRSPGMPALSGKHCNVQTAANRGVAATVLWPPVLPNGTTGKCRSRWRCR